MLTLPRIYFCARSPGARTSTASGGAADDSSSAAKGALTRSVAAVSSGREVQRVQAVLQISGHVIEADSASRVADSFSRLGSAMITMGCSRSRSVPAHVAYWPAEPDVDAAGEMRGRKFAGVARVENLRAGTLQREHVVNRHGGDVRECLIEGRPLLTVEHRVIVEIRGSFGLIGGYHLNEGLLAHGLQGVVQPALLAERGYRVFADRFAAKRTRAMRGIDEARVGQRQQLGVQRIEQQAAEIGGRPAERGAQIGAANIADEQSISGEHGVGLGVADVQVIDHDGNGFGSVPGRLEDLETHASEFDDGGVAQRDERIRGLRGGPR